MANLKIDPSVVAPRPRPQRLVIIIILDIRRLFRNVSQPPPPHDASGVQAHSTKVVQIRGESSWESMVAMAPPRYGINTIPVILNQAFHMCHDGKSSSPSDSFFYVFYNAFLFAK
jgi:hypothetical protein